MKNNMLSTRMISIDIARAICIFLVVIGHYIPNNSPNWYVTMHDVIYTFHMPLFMFVSGLVYWATRKPVKYNDFVWKKFQRLMIPYFFVSVIVIVLKLFTESKLLVEDPVEISDLYRMFYLPVAGDFLWFVFALFLMFLIIPLFNTRKRLSVLLLLSLFLYLVPVTFPVIFCLAKFKINLLYFVLGCAFFEWSNVRQFLDKTHFLVLLCFFIGIYLLKTYIEVLIITNILAICIAFVGIIFIINLSKQIELTTVSVKKILAAISEYSYTIYLFHTTVEGFAKAILAKFFYKLTETNNQLVFICTALIVILLGLIAPVILHKITVSHSRLFSYLIGAKFNKPEIEKMRNDSP